MKRKLPLLLIMSLLIAGCKYAQVLHIEPSGSEISEENNFFTYENDSLKIVYSFWGERGNMTFFITNKFNKPLYIDWKKSSFIDDNQKFNYYEDRESSSAMAISKGGGSSTKWGYGVFSSAFSTIMAANGITVKEERITFLPPKSYVISPRSFRIWNVNYAIQIRQSESRRLGKKMFLTDVDNNTALHFRNFITYSTSESFTREQYIDNEFYVDRVTTMKKKKFLGKQINNHGDREFPYSDPKAFYIWTNKGVIRK